MRKQGAFREVVLSLLLWIWAGRRFLGEDGGECLRMRLWGCPLFNGRAYTGVLTPLRPTFEALIQLVRRGAE